MYRCFCNSITKIVLKKPAAVETTKKVAKKVKADDAKTFSKKEKPKKKKKKTAGLNIPDFLFDDPFSPQPSTSKGKSSSVNLAQLSSFFSAQKESTGSINKMMFSDFL